jgi:hypothetical protein
MSPTGASSRSGRRRRSWGRCGGGLVAGVLMSLVATVPFAAGATAADAPSTCLGVTQASWSCSQSEKGPVVVRPYGVRWQ